MQYQTKKADEGQESLICTYGNCKELQTEQGEFCKKHYPKMENKTKEYKVFVTETLGTTIYVNAKNKDDAREKAFTEVCKNTPDLETIDGYEIEGCDIEETK